MKKEVSETTDDIEPDDVFDVKNKLKGFGYYKEPEWGMTKFSDRPMFDGIRKFQTNTKLKIDGIMKPEGETEVKVNEKIKTERLQNKGMFSTIYSQGYKIGESVVNPSVQILSRRR